MIELLISISIIGLLASIVFTTVVDARTRSRDAVRVAVLGEMYKAILLTPEDSGLFTGCTGRGLFYYAGYPPEVPGNNAASCTGPSPVNFTSYADPKVGISGPLCTSFSTSPCQYVIGSVDGTLTPATTWGWEVCTFLENGVGPFPAGLVHVGSNTDGAIQTGC